MSIVIQPPIRSPMPSSARPQQPAVVVPAPPLVTSTQQGDAQIEHLVGQLAGLEIQRIDLTGQLRSSDAAVQLSAQGQLAAVNAQIAETKQAIKNVHDAMGNQPQIIVPSLPAVLGRSSALRDDLFGVFAIVFTVLVLMPIAIGFGRRLWRKGAPASPSIAPDLLSPRLDRMEQAIDAIAIEVERISESQRFITRVLTERGETPAVPAQSGLGAGAAVEPARALGAGPLQEIRMPERHAARASITPH